MLAHYFHLANTAACMQCPSYMGGASEVLGSLLVVHDDGG